MDKQLLQEAKAEALRFLRRVRELEAVAPFMQRYGGGQLTGAVRRASMDLTRALAKLRR